LDKDETPLFFPKFQDQFKPQNPKLNRVVYWEHGLWNSWTKLRAIFKSSTKYFFN